MTDRGRIILTYRIRFFTIEDSAGLQATGYDQTIITGDSTACLFKNPGIDQANVEKHFADAVASASDTQVKATEPAETAPDP